MSEHEAKPYRILIVDDEPTIRHFYSSILDLEGFHVETAADGVAAWGLLQTLQYDLVITDQSMPGMLGTELFRKTRTMKTPPPVILATGVYPVNDDGLAFDAILVKPFFASVLIATVNRVLKQAHAAAKFSA